MSVQPPDPEQTEGYCDPADVADFFDKYDTFDDETNPTRAQVKARIMAASNWIDDFTGHAWRERRVTGEYKSLSNKMGGASNYYWRAGTPLKLMKRSIRTPLDESKGDKIEFWQGNEWNDWVSDPNMDEGRDGDYWVEDATGQLYVYRRHIFFQRHKEIRVDYRYGKETVPQTIRDVCARRTAAHYLESQQYRVTVPGNEEAPDALTVAEKWREICEEDLGPFKELRTMGTM